MAKAHSYAATEAMIDASEEYRRRIVAAFGSAEPATYGPDGCCELCGESVKCPGWHAPAEEEE